MFCRSVFLLMLAYVVVTNANAQTTTDACASPESKQFDFWIGEWDAVYKDTVHATNAIVKEMDGCVIHERFNDPSQQFKGESWSVYDPKQKIWQQTWVDNQGGYIVLTGTFENNRMTLTTEPRVTQDGTKAIFRMVFYNIMQDAFDWKWESTRDNGNTWKEAWKIRYTRKK